MVSRGILISIEGIEGCGKSTLIEGLQNSLSFGKRNIIYTREPGGCTTAEAIRAMLASPMHNGINQMTELLMIYAARSEHIDKVIGPSLEAGDVVITDRYYDSSYAYQVGGQGLDRTYLSVLDNWIIKGYEPSLTIYLKIPIDVALQRVSQRGKRDKFDHESAEFFIRVQKEFERRARQNPERMVCIDGQDRQAVVLARVKQMIEEKEKLCGIHG